MQFISPGNPQLELKEILNEGAKAATIKRYSKPKMANEVNNCHNFHTVKCVSGTGD